MKKKVAPSTAPAFEYLYFVEWDSEDDTNPALQRIRVRKVLPSGDVAIVGRPLANHCRTRVHKSVIGFKFFYDPAEAWVHFLDNQRDGHRLDLARAIRRERVMTMTPPPVEDAE